MRKTDDLKFGDDGLLPAIAQDRLDGTVLMLAYVNREALQMTIQTGQAHYWSRSRNKLWRKGESSGNFQLVERIKYDCDEDALLFEVDQIGPACHTGEKSCFFRQIQMGRPAEGGADKLAQEEKTGEPLNDMLKQIYKVILDRKVNKKKDSYVCSLFQAGQDKILKKIGEEAAELVIASKNGDKLEIIKEAADLWFHTLVLLGSHDIEPEEVGGELRSRFGKRHLKEK